MGRLNTNYNGMTHEEWCEELDERNRAFLNGTETLTLPESFFTLETNFGCFIEVQPECWLSHKPGVVVRDTHWAGALKVLCPKNIKPGDTIRVVRKAASGKSYIAEK